MDGLRVMLKQKIDYIFLFFCELFITLCNNKIK